MTQKPLKIFNASAGSGKTYTLVQEYLRIILHHSNPAKFRTILAMTFTNKAANEMKERILSGLIDLSVPTASKNEKQLKFLIDTSKNIDVAPQLIEKRSAAILNKILHNYGAFSVMTIDKFTHKVIRTFAKDLNISIDFDVELDMKTLRKSVTDLLFDQIGRDKELTRLMLRYAQTNLAEDKSWNFSKQLFEFSNEIFKEEAIRGIDLLKKLTSEDFLKIQTELIKENEIISNKILQQAIEALDLASSKNLEPDDFKGKGNSILGYFKRRTAKNFKDKPSPTLLKDVSEGNWGHPQSPNKGAADEIGPQLGQYFYQLEHLLVTEYGKYIINKEVLKNLNNLSLLNHLLAIVAQIKEEENILLISDFYKKIAEIITEEPVPFIYERLGVRYEHFLLDEFQDTSHLQWINMIPLVHNSLAANHTNLIVGDGKQAIYRWRNGEVEQFTGLPERIHNPQNIASLSEAEPLFAALGEKYPLKHNFRSADEIVAFNNDIFSNLIKGLPDSLKSIYDDIKQIPTRNLKGYVEAFFQNDLEKDDQLDYVHKTILRTIEKGFDLKDICILTRNKKEGATISKFLNEQGIRVISPESLFIGKDTSVKFISNLIAALNNPTNINFKIKTLEHFGSIIAAKETKVIIDENEKLIQTSSITEIMKRYGYTINPPTHYHNMFEFVEGLMETFAFNLNNNPFLQFFLEQVHLYEKHQSSSIREFMDWYFDRGHQSSIISPEGANAVQVMTIHKSKGLQFPVVICPFVDWKIELHKQISWIDNPGESLPAFFLKMNSELKETKLADIYLSEEGKFLLDQINLLYVAFTRPEIALFICGNASKTSSPAKNWLAPYFKESVLGEMAGDLFTFGSFVNTEKGKNVEVNNYPVSFTTKRMEKPVLSYKSAENWDIHELDEKRLFGTKLHYLLSRLEGINGLASAVEKALKKGTISAEEAPLLKTKIQHLFEHSDFRFYFEQENQLNERAIITTEGSRFIPDKIISSKDKTLIVDFKTGHASPSHKKQLLNYMQLMHDMGYVNVSGELYYTEDNQVVSCSL